MDGLDPDRRLPLGAPGAVKPSAAAYADIFEAHGAHCSGIVLIPAVEDQRALQQLLHPLKIRPAEGGPLRHQQQSVRAGERLVVLVDVLYAITPVGELLTSVRCRLRVVSPYPRPRLRKPRDSEGIPVSAMEAMAAGVLPIAPAAQKARRADLRAKARERIESRFNATKNYPEFIKVLHGIATDFCHPKNPPFLSHPEQPAPPCQPRTA